MHDTCRNTMKMKSMKSSPHRKITSGWTFEYIFMAQANLLFGWHLFTDLQYSDQLLLIILSDSSSCRIAEKTISWYVEAEI